MNQSHSNSQAMISRQGSEADVKSAALKQAAITALRKWWAFAIPLGVLCGVGAAVGVFYNFEPQYVARATVRIEPISLLWSDVRGKFDEKFIRTEQQLLRSPWVMGQVVSRPDIAELPEIQELEDPIASLGQKVGYHSQNGSNLYDITYQGPNAVNAAKIVNAVLDAYFKLRDEDEKERMNTILEVLGKEHAVHRDKVERLREVVRDMTKQNPGDVEEKEVLKEDSPAVMLRRQLVELEVKQMLLRVEIATLKEIGDKHPTDVTPEEIAAALASDPEMKRISEKIEMLQVEIKKLEDVLRAPESSPQYRQWKMELQQQQTDLAARKKVLDETLPGELKAGKDQLRAEQLETMEAELEGLEKYHEILDGKLEKEIVRESHDRVENLELVFKKAELERAETVFEMIATKIEKLHTEQRAPATVTEMWKAIPPVAPLEKFPIKQMGLAGVAAFGLPLLLAFGWEWRVRRVSTAEQLGEDLPVISEIASFPAVRSTSRGLSRSAARDLRRFEESVHNLRTYLVLSQPLVGAKVISVTSSVSGEGKTSVASQLALSFARANGKVLVIDADMRSPDICNVFDIENEPGLAEVLEGRVSLEDAIYKGWSDNVHILPAGQLSFDPHRLVSNGSIERLLASVRDEYVTIIIDTPPVLAASESLVIARAADANLLCTRRDRSRVSQVSVAHKRLQAAGARTAGAVFVGVAGAEYQSKYGYYDYDNPVTTGAVEVV